VITPLPSPRAARFQHVVFAEPARRRRLVDFAPANATPAAPRETSISRAGDDAFVRWLFDQAELDASCYRPETLRRRLPACLRLLRASNCAQAKQVLQADPTRLGAALDAMIIGVTSFFRDADVFDHLTYTALRELGRRTRGLRIWSAGCSDGEELHSISMLLAEMDLLNGAYLLGTDCRAPAIARAREARYAKEALDDVPVPWVRRYFTGGADRWQIVPPLRRSAQWRVADVTRTCDAGGWDLIFCRNLAMYLLPEMAARLWERLEQAIRPGGFLVVGKAERPISAPRLIPLTSCIYRRSWV